MKRLLAVTIIALAMLIALPATAKKPPKPEPPEPPPEFVCAFSEDGGLLDSHGEPIALDARTKGYRCKLTANAEDSFTFVIETARQRQGGSIPLRRRNRRIPERRQHLLP